jgi:exopolysaccharide biosynthesis polyprenyl glycosylphosphotransferase
MLIVAAIAAYRFRVDRSITQVIPVDYVLDFPTYFQYALIVSLFWVILFAFTGLYVTKSNRRLSNELGKIIIGCSLGLVLVTFAIFLQRELFSSRFIILAAWGFSILCVFIGRVFIAWLQRQFLKKGLGSIKLIIIGNDLNTKIVIEELQKNPSHGYRVVKNYADFSPAVQNKILHLHDTHVLDEIVVTDTSVDKETMLSIIDFTEEYHLGFRYAADLFNAKATNTSVEPIAGIPLIELKKSSLEGWGRIAKRTFDVLVALFFIILFSPVMVIAALAVKLTSEGPVIFKNERVGQKGVFFDTFKFRSMRSEYSVGRQFHDSHKALEYEQELIKKQDTRKDGVLYKIKDDPRLTSIGAFIRRWSIDELPQFFNVLKGDMSIVGPRPHQPREVRNYDRHHKRLLTVKPGITGMAQVSGRSDLAFDDEAKLDIYYIENWSPWLDLQIILKTPLAVLKNRNVQ